MLKKLLSLLSDVAVYGVSSLLSQAIGFFLLPIYTRYLTPTDQGLVTMVLTVTAFFGPLGRLGIINSIFRRYNFEKSPEERLRILSAGLCTVVVSSALLLVVSWILAPEIARFAVGDAQSGPLVRLSLVAAALSTLGMVPLAELRAKRQVKTVATINVLKVLIAITTTLVLVVGLEEGPRGVIVGSLVGEVASTLLLFAMTFRSYTLNFGLATWRPLFWFGLPAIPHQLQAMAMAMLGQFAVGKMLGLNEAGIYATAMRFSIPVAFVVNSVQTAWSAYKYQVHAEDEDPAAFFRTAVTYYVAGILYLWVGVSVWGPELVWLMTEKSYHAAAGLVAVTALIPVSQGVYYMMGTGMELGDNIRPFPFITFAGLVTAAISVRTLIPVLGATGAAMASINSFIVLAILIYYFSQRRFSISYDWSTLIALGLLAAIAAFASNQSLAMPAYSRIGVAVAISVVFPLCEFAILSRSETERHRMRILWDRVSRIAGRKTAKSTTA